MPSAVRRSSRSSLRQRRGPLQELALDSFPHALDVHHKRMSNSTFKPVTKRPRSPSMLMSPTKRRILRDEGLCVTPSAARERRILSQLQASQSSLFGNRLASLTPVKQGKLSPRISDGSRSPTTPSKSPSPRAKTTSRRYVSLSFSPKRTSARLQARHSAASPPTSPPSPILFSRELPPSPDRQSLHYPGFDIYRDTHIELPRVMSQLCMDLDNEKDGDIMKENRAPRKSSKIASSGKEESLCTPRAKVPLYDGPSFGAFGTPTAYASLRADMLSAMKSPSKHSNADTLSKRRKMELEADNIYSEDEDDEMFTL